MERNGFLNRLFDREKNQYDYEDLEGYRLQLRLYLMAPLEIVSDYEAELKRLVSEKKKVVLLTENYSLKGATVYDTKVEAGQLRFITDSSYVLTGELTDDEHNTCLYSGQKNLVEVMKEALKNKITLLGK